MVPLRQTGLELSHGASSKPWPSNSRLPHMSAKALPVTSSFAPRAPKRAIEVPLTLSRRVRITR
eukprot:1486372-Prymnesium_polylepis.2